MRSVVAVGDCGYEENQKKHQGVLVVTEFKPQFEWETVFTSYIFLNQCCSAIDDCSLNFCEQDTIPRRSANIMQYRPSHADSEPFRDMYMDISVHSSEWLKIRVGRAILR